MGASDTEKGGIPDSPTATPADIANATENTEGANLDNDPKPTSSSSSDLPPPMEEKDQKGAFVSHFPAIDPDAPIVVSRSNRRGLFGQLTLLAEIEDPKTYSRRKKWFITFIVAVAGATAPMGSSIFFPALSQVSRELHTTPTVTNLSISLYMLSMSIFPLWWSSFSERLGRRTIYLISFVFFVVFNVVCAVSKSIAMLIVMRMLSGGASASVQAVGAGTIADLWASRERGRAMGIFYLGPLCGPLLAPIIGGALAERWRWRSTMWFLAAYGGITVIFILFALPETLAVPKTPVRPVSDTGAGQSEPIGRRLSRVSSRKVVGVTTKWLKMLKIFFLDPLDIVLYLRHPPVLLTVYYASITFGALYVLNVSVEHTFGSEPYGFSTIIVGLLYIPNSLGYVITSIFGGPWMDNIMHREAKKANRYDEHGNLVFRPEDRMRENAWLGALLFPAALIWYGWTAQNGVFWLVPMIANFFFGIGSMLIFSMSTTMLTEFMPKKSSSGVALNNFVRNIFSCIGSFVAAPILSGIGNGWLFTILGLVCFASSGVLWIMRVYGSQMRKSMDAHMK